MCRKKTYYNSALNWHHSYAAREQGFSLLMVLAIMVIIAIMVIAGSQVSNTEMRISANSADRKHTFSLAERALAEGEEAMADKAMVAGSGSASGTSADAPRKPIQEADLVAMFTNECVDGLCKPADVNNVLKPAWERDKILTGNSGDNSVATGISGGAKTPRYIVEYLGVNGAEGRMFRVTARAWGENPNTNVTLQSYISTPVPKPAP